MVRPAGPLTASTDAPRRPAVGAGTAVAGAVMCLVCLVGALALGPWLPPGADPAARVGLLGVAWLAFAAAAWLVLRAPPRAAVVLILVGAAGLQLAAGVGPPRSSDDLYRYIWDGRVQAAGFNPYAHPPAAPELVGLRDGFLWPDRAAWCVQPDTEGVVPGCTRINRPTVHTIYPPVAQAFFAAVHALSPAGSGHRPMQLAAGLVAVGVTVLLLAGLRRRHGDPRRAVLWAWCPVVALEAGSNAHIDVLAAGLAAAALLLLAPAPAGQRAGGCGVETSRTGLGGLLLGLAIATKVTPALLLPAVLRRRPVLVLGAVVAAVAAVYLPHVAAVGGRVLGYLPGYLDEEGYTTGDRFALLTTVVPAAWAPAVAAAILTAAGAAALWRRSPADPWLAAALVTGSAILVAAPSYPWYALLLVVLVALGARGEWLVVAAGGYIAQYAGELSLDRLLAQRIGYGAALAAVLLGWWLRRRTARR